MGLLDFLSGTKVNNPALVEAVRAYRADSSDDRLLDLWQKFLKSKVLLATNPDAAKTFGKSKSIRECISLPFVTHTNERADMLMAVFTDNNAFAQFGGSHTCVATTGENALTLCHGKNLLGMVLNPTAEPTCDLKVWQHQLFIERIADANKLHGIATKLTRSGNYQDAEGVLKGAVLVAHKDPGPHHPFTAELNVDLARVMRVQGKLNEAEWVYKRALTIYETTGSHDLEVATTSEALGILLVEINKQPQAIPLLTRALEIFESVPGAKPDSIGRILGLLAEIKIADNCHQDAEGYYKKAALILEEKKHPDLAGVLNKMGALCETTDRLKEALAHYTKCIAIGDTFKRCKETDIAHAVRKAGEIYLRQGNLDEAGPLLDRALSTFQLLPGSFEEEIAEVELLIKELNKERTAPPPADGAESGNRPKFGVPSKKPSTLPLLDFGAIKQNQNKAVPVVSSNAPKDSEPNKDPEEEALDAMRSFLNSVDVDKLKKPRPEENESQWETVAQQEPSGTLAAIKLQEPSGPQKAINLQESTGEQSAIRQSEAGAPQEVIALQEAITKKLKEDADKALLDQENAAIEAEAKRIAAAATESAKFAAPSPEKSSAAGDPSDINRASPFDADRWDTPINQRSTHQKLEPISIAEVPAAAAPVPPPPPPPPAAIRQSGEHRSAPTFDDVSYDQLFAKAGPKVTETASPALEQAPTAPPPAVVPDEVDISSLMGDTLFEEDQQPQPAPAMASPPAPVAPAAAVAAEESASVQNPQAEKGLFEAPVDLDISSAFLRALVRPEDEPKDERYDQPISARAQAQDSHESESSDSDQPTAATTTEAVSQVSDDAETAARVADLKAKEVTEEIKNLFGGAIDAEISGIFNKSVLGELKKDSRFDKAISQRSEDSTECAAPAPAPAPAPAAIPPKQTSSTPPVPPVPQLHKASDEGWGSTASVPQSETAAATDTNAAETPAQEWNEAAATSDIYKAIIEAAQKSPAKPAETAPPTPVQPQLSASPPAEQDAPATAPSRPALDASRFDTPISERTSSANADRFDKPISERAQEAKKETSGIFEEDLESSLSDAFNSLLGGNQKADDRFEKPVNERDSSRFDTPIAERSVSAPDRFDTPISERKSAASSDNLPALDPDRFDKPISERMAESSSDRLPALDPDRFDKPISERLAESSSDRLPALDPDRFDKPISERVAESSSDRLPALDPDRFDKPIAERVAQAPPAAAAQADGGIFTDLDDSLNDAFNSLLGSKAAEPDRFEKPIAERNAATSQTDLSRFDTPIADRTPAKLDPSRFDTPIAERTTPAAATNDADRFDKPIAERLGAAAAAPQSPAPAEQSGLFSDLDDSLSDAFKNILADPKIAEAADRFDKPIAERMAAAAPAAAQPAPAPAPTTFVPPPPVLPAVTGITAEQERQLGQAKTPEDLLKLLEQQLQVEPNNSELWLRKGTALVQQQRIDEAIKIFDKVTCMSPNDIKAWYCKGSSLHLKNRFEDAIYCFNHVLKLDNENVKAMLRKAECLQKLGRADQCMVIYDRILVLQPRFVNGWLSKARALLQQRRLPEALICYEEALVLEPSNEEAAKAKNLISAKLSTLATK